jgi:hypothetical protein
LRRAGEVGDLDATISYTPFIGAIIDDWRATTDDDEYYV